jgi:hypothetical protein
LVQVVGPLPISIFGQTGKIGSSARSDTGEVLSSGFGFYDRVTRILLDNFRGFDYKPPR